MMGAILTNQSEPLVEVSLYAYSPPMQTFVIERINISNKQRVCAIDFRLGIVLGVRDYRDYDKDCQQH